MFIFNCVLNKVLTAEPRGSNVLQLLFCADLSAFKDNVQFPSQSHFATGSHSFGIIRYVHFVEYSAPPPPPFLPVVRDRVLLSTVMRRVKMLQSMTDRI